MLRSATTMILSLSATIALAEAPSVLVDTAPLHSLVAQVMEGVGTPDLLMPPGISPHDFQFRPSDAGKLADAGIIIWVGHGLTPWLEEPIETLATGSVTLELLDVDGWPRLDMREEAAFSAADADQTAHNHSHDHTDPHAWLSPDVASIWVAAIADTLADADPANADAYRSNATAAQTRLSDLKEQIIAELAPVLGRSFIVPHDAYQYFETAFGMPAAGAITLSDAATPGPARVAELRDMVAGGAVTCILTDPETSAEWSAVIAEGSGAQTAMVDPDGINLAVGPDLYDAILRGIADALVECLS